MFSAFFEEIYWIYFNGTNLLTPIVCPGMDVSTISIIRTVISHAYIARGLLPTCMAFPSLACYLLGQKVSTSSFILVETLIDSLSNNDSGVMKRAVKKLQGQVQLRTFSSDLMPQILSVLSRFGVRKLPSPSSFRNTLIEVATYEFLSKPSAALFVLHLGVPDLQKPFRRGLSVNNLFSIYCAQCVSVETVLGMLEDSLDTKPNDECILCYLCQYVGSINSTMLRKFLRLVTGSTVCSSPSISVSFNSLSSLQ